jgi:tricorn protease
MHCRPPLNAVGVEAKPGERIVAVNGQKTSRERPPQSLLVHQAGTKVELVLAGSKNARGGAERDEHRSVVRSVLVSTLSDEVPARYREWVERNRAWVHAQSKGRVGYLHLPDMMSAGFAEFHRYFAGECDRDGLVIDVRYNRGGHVSQLLLEKVARKRIGYNMSRWSLPTPYPDEAVNGPVVALTNEHAGSDGDIFSHCFKLMAIGPLVGTRTWGGVVGIWPRHTLVDARSTQRVLVLVQRYRRGWNPDRSADRGGQRAAGCRCRPRSPARDRAGDGGGADRARRRA